MPSLRSLGPYGSLLFAATGVIAAFSSGAPVARAPKLDFNRDVRPILSEHCWQCHGADQAQVKKARGLRLDSAAAATRDLGGYRAIVPKDLEHSRAWARITATDDDRMPPVDSGVKPLDAREKSILKQWILEGAEYKGHWAFIPPTDPVAPTIKNPKWARNPIDRFVAAKLEQNGLKPEPEADRPTLIRRVALSLIGLAPTPTEVDAFLGDAKPGAYERMVDRYLADARYGEHQARYWLDAIRYGDTHGLHLDNERGIWPYRDWVVSAFNRDLPFDKFTLWQVAGDLLPNPTQEQKLATGYVRMNPTTSEGGAIEQEFLVKNTFDRVDTTSTVYLGMSIACAKCHDHKYDPFSQRDYYSLFAYFNSTADSPLDGNAKDHPPVIRVATPSQQAELDRINAAMGKLESQTALTAAREFVINKKVVSPTVGKWQTSPIYSAADYKTAFDRDDAPVTTPDQVAWKAATVKLDSALNNIIRKDNSAIYFRTTLTVDQHANVSLRLGSDDGIKVWLDGKVVHSNMASRGLTLNEDTVNVHLHPGENRLLCKVVNGAGADGFSIGIGGKDDVRLAQLTKLANKPTPTEAEALQLKQGYLEFAPSGVYRSYLSRKKAIETTLPTSLVAQELMKPRPAYVLRRGEYNLQGDKVDRALPAALGKIPAGAPNNRLGLAQWLISPENPLVARVFVNRLWQQHFGTGIVKSAEDFGSRGEFPSHPELLDYLAVRFQKDGWSIKKLQRLILNSASFRQAATTTAQKRAKDPENRLISHGPRFRLDAEVIRDQALEVSGLLDETLGGPGVKPYQPPGLWEAVAYTDSNTAKYMQDHGVALHRRSLYTFWKRTSPPPSMPLFDAPMRESCVVSRSRTNTPLQALATMNDPQFVEASRAFAQRLLETKPTDAARFEYAFRLLVSRRPTTRETAALGRLLTEQRRRYATNSDAATHLLSVGESARDPKLPPAEHAAWTVVCNTLLNLDEVLTQH